MKLNVEELKNDLFDGEFLNKFENKMLENYGVERIKDWDKICWITFTTATLGFSFSDIVINFLELNKEFFEDKIDCTWDLYTEKVLNSFCYGNHEEVFEKINCEPFFDVVEELAKKIAESILSKIDLLDNKKELICSHCNANLRETGLYSKKPSLIIYNKYAGRLELEPLLSDGDFDTYCCICDNKLNSKEYCIYK